MKAAQIAETQLPNTPVAEEVVEAEAQRHIAKRKVTKLKTLGTFLRRGACSTTLMTVLDRANGHPMALEERATEPLAGGLMRGYQCGMIWGSALAAGAEAHRQHGAGPQAETASLGAAEKIVDSFRACHKHVDCLDITDTNPQNKWQTFKYFLLKGGTISCARRIARYAPEAQRTINESLSTASPQTGCNRANCAASLARQMGATDVHVTMAASLAGGIGLSGGACGALGAAIWITGLKGRAAGDSNKAINQRIESLMERFQIAADYEFECSEIVGREFDGSEDHSRHVRDGGCAAILAALAAE